MLQKVILYLTLVFILKNILTSLANKMNFSFHINTLRIINCFFYQNQEQRWRESVSTIPPWMIASWTREEAGVGRGVIIVPSQPAIMALRGEILDNRRKWRQWGQGRIVSLPRLTWFLKFYCLCKILYFTKCTPVSWTLCGK